MTKNVFFTRQRDYKLDGLCEKISFLLTLAGGWDYFFSDGDDIILKPNLVASVKRERHATTNPPFVEAMILVCKEHNVNIKVMDSPAIDSTKTVAKKTGLLEVCKRHNVPCLSFSGTKKIPGTAYNISSDIKDNIKIINLPKLKGHTQVYYTGAVKNLFGCVTGKRKFFRHLSMGNKQDDFSEMILRTAAHINPTLSIMDGIIAHEGYGPTNGSPRTQELLALSENAFALDGAVLDWLSADKMKIPYFKKSHELSKIEFSFKYELKWLGDSFVSPGFYFPEKLNPIRFTIRHSIRSLYRSLSLYLKKQKVKSKRAHMH